MSAETTKTAKTTTTKTKITIALFTILGLLAVVGLIAFTNYLPTLQKYQRDDARTADLEPLKRYALEYKEQFGIFPEAFLDAWQQLLTDNSLDALPDGATDAKYYFSGICTYGDDTCTDLADVSWSTHSRAIYVTYKSACTDADHDKDHVSPIIETDQKDDITIVTAKESGGYQCLDVK